MGLEMARSIAEIQKDLDKKLAQIYTDNIRQRFIGREDTKDQY